MNSEIPLFKVFMSPRAKHEVGKILDSGWIAQGKITDEYETKLSKWLDHPRVATVNSCTSAIHLTLYYLKQKYNWENPEVITTPLTCAATNMPIVTNGYTLKWADVSEDYNINIDSIKNAITDKTKVIILVHWGGNYINYDELRSKIPDDIHIIEDCAHAWGAEWKGEKNPKESKNHWKCYSTQAIKTLTTGDGGALCVPNDEDFKEIRKLRWFGLDRDNDQDFRSGQDIQTPGWKFQTNDIASAIGLENLKFLPYLIKKARECADYYNENISNDLISKPIVHKDSNPSWWLYTLSVKHRNEFIDHLKKHNISAHWVHTRNDKLSCFSQYKEKLPLMDSIENNMVCIPCGWWLDKHDMEKIVEVVNGYNPMETR